MPTTTETKPFARLQRVETTAKALLAAFGGDTPSYLRREAVALENAIYGDLGEVAA